MTPDWGGDVCTQLMPQTVNAAVNCSGVERLLLWRQIACGVSPSKVAEETGHTPSTTVANQCCPLPCLLTPLLFAGVRQQEQNTPAQEWQQQRW